MKNYNLQSATYKQRGLPRKIAPPMRGCNPREEVRFVRGQSLFEVILALAVSVVMLTGIISLTSKGVSTSTLSKNKAQANRYASEGMEYIRTQKEFLGWPTFKSIITAGGGRWCLKTLEFIPANNLKCTASDFVVEPSGNTTIFIRSLTLYNITNKSMDLDVVVLWVDEKGTHETYTIGAISDW